MLHPFVGMAAKMTDAPAQIGLPPFVLPIVTDGVSVVATATVTPALATVSGFAQVELEVRTQFTICPFVNVEVVYVGLLVPTLVVPTFH